MINGSGKIFKNCLARVLRLKMAYFGAMRVTARSTTRKLRNFACILVTAGGEGWFILSGYAYRKARKPNFVPNRHRWKEHQGITMNFLVIHRSLSPAVAAAAAGHQATATAAAAVADRSAPSTPVAMNISDDKACAAAPSDDGSSPSPCYGGHDMTHASGAV